MVGIEAHDDDQHVVAGDAHVGDQLLAVGREEAQIARRDGGRGRAGSGSRA
jgi:hypothetical protein